jgi:hypothetical protein
MLRNESYSRDFGVAVDEVWFVNGSTDHKYTPLGTTSSYTLSPILHYKRLQHPPSLFPVNCVFISHSLATASNNGDSSAFALRLYLNSLPCRAAFQLTGSLQLSSSYPLCTDQVENIFSKSNCIVVLIFADAGTCLLIRLLEMDWITSLFICLLHSNGCMRYSIFCHVRWFLLCITQQ